MYLHEYTHILMCVYVYINLNIPWAQSATGRA